MSEVILHGRPNNSALADTRTGNAPPTDGELLARFSTHGNQQAFAELVRRHGALVMGVCRRVLDDAHDAEDAFQATFLVLAQKSSGIRRPELLGNWLYGVAFRVARKAKNAKRKRIEMPAAEPIAASLGIDAALKELQAVIDEELQRLPDAYRMLLILCYFQGLSHSQVARQLGWRLGSVSRRLAKAHKLLRARLTRRGLTLSAGLLLLLLGQIGMPAPVSALLVHSTTHAATALAAGNALTSVASLKVAALSYTFKIAPKSLFVLLLAGLLFVGPCGLVINAGRPSAGAAASDVAGTQAVSSETSADGLTSGTSQLLQGSSSALGASPPVVQGSCHAFDPRPIVQ